MSAKSGPADIDEYIATFSVEQQAVLQLVREAIHRGVPNGQEKIRYDMAAIMIAGRYGIHFAGWKRHVGLYAVPPMPEPLEAELTGYRRAKDSVAFPWSDPIPFELIERISGAIAEMHQD